MRSSDVNGLSTQGLAYLHGLWAHGTVGGLGADNVGSLADNAARWGLRVAMIVGSILPCLRARVLTVCGLLQLHDPASFRTKERSKLSVLDYILQPNLYEDLYGAYDHKVHIHYYKSRRDNKER
jgi:hypothetical protein